MTASLGTWRNFWGSRLPYLEVRGMNADVPRFAVAILEKASGEHGEHADADVARLQEVTFGRGKRKAQPE